MVNQLARRAGEPERLLVELVQEGRIEYIPFPEALKGKYQSFTQADIGALRAAGYTRPFRTVQQGVAEYVDWLADG